MIKRSAKEGGITTFVFISLCLAGLQKLSLNVITVI